MKATAQSECGSSSLANIIAQGDAALGTLVHLAGDHVDFDHISNKWMKLDSLILHTPSRAIRDQVAQLRHLVAIMVYQEDVSPYAEALARYVLAEMETLDN